jgi:hypothetical protein
MLHVERECHAEERAEAELQQLHEDKVTNCKNIKTSWKSRKLVIR